MISTETKNLLFSALRRSLIGEISSDVYSENCCDELLEFGRKQSLLPLLYSGLKDMGLPESIVRKFDVARLPNIQITINQEYSLKRIETVLSSNQIPYVLLKGACLRKLYPDPFMRTSGDIDILVHDYDIDRAVDSIEKDTDFSYIEKGYHDVSMVNDTTHLELHFSIKENNESVDRILSKAWDYSICVDGKYRYEFTPEYQLFYIVSHMCRHFVNGGLGVRPLLDLWLLVTKTNLDENKAMSLLDKCNMVTFYKECCNLTNVWLRYTEYSECTSLFEEICLSGGVFGSAEFKNACRQRKYKGYKYIASRVFPPIYQVKEYYNDSPSERHSSGYYYIKRIRSWISRRRRSDLHKHIRGIVSTDQDYLRKADRLLELLDIKKV